MNSFDARGTLTVGGRDYEIYRLEALQSKYDIARLPFSLKILLENLLRHEDGASVTADDIKFLACWDPNAEPSREILIQRSPARSQEKKNSRSMAWPKVPSSWPASSGNSSSESPQPSGVFF